MKESLMLISTFKHQQEKISLPSCKWVYFWTLELRCFSNSVSKLLTDIDSCRADSLHCNKTRKAKLKQLFHSTTMKAK